MNAILIGDLLTRPKAFGAAHVGVWLGGGAVFHNAPDRGDQVTSVADFAKGEPVTIVRTNAEAAAVVVRVRTRLASPRRYDLLVNNCEHAANEIVTGRAFSPQIQATAVVAIGLLVLYFVMRGQ